MLVINQDKCFVCGLCADICPVEAISQIGIYKIDPEICIQCRECEEDCPMDAIDNL